MRIIAGQAKGRRLKVPPNSAIRPTSDRVREAIFNALFSLGGVADQQVIDVFAGSGALGLEAISRGAAHACFIDRDPAAIKAVRRNIATLGFEAQSTVRQGDALKLLDPQRHQPVMGQPVVGQPVVGQPAPSQPNFRFDIAFCDPPYVFADWKALLAKLNCRLLVAETNARLELDSSWKIHKCKRFGATFVNIAENLA